MTHGILNTTAFGAMVEPRSYQQALEFLAKKTFYKVDGHGGQLNFWREGPPSPEVSDNTALHEIPVDDPAEIDV
jgi:hypothetical protein